MLAAARSWLAWSQPLVWGETGEGWELEPSVNRAVSFLLCSTTTLEQLRVLGALAALSSRVVEHSQGAVMLVRGIAKPPARFAVAKFGLWQFCTGAAEPRLPSLELPQQPALLCSPRVLTHTHSVTEHGPMARTWWPALLRAVLPDALLSPGISQG